MHAGLKARGARTDAHVSVNSVVERMLAAEAEDAALAGEPLPSLESATSPHLPAPARQKQGQSRFSFPALHMYFRTCSTPLHKPYLVLGLIFRCVLSFCLCMSYELMLV